MKTDELTGLMREHDELGAVPVLADSRMTGIQRKVTASRRRAAAVTASVAIAVIAAAGLPLLHLLPTTKTHNAAPAATGQIKRINGFPEYENGAHLVSTGTAATDAAIELTATPVRTDLALTWGCPDTGPNVQLWIEMSVNGHDIGGGSCANTSSSGSYTPETSAWRDYGVVAGKPATFTFRVTKADRVSIDAQGEEQKPTPISIPAGRFTAAVLQRVPFAEYPLPARPAKLPALNVRSFNLGDAKNVTIASSGSDPLTGQTLDFTWPAKCGTDGSCVTLSATSQTPGYLHITLDNGKTWTAEFWDYGAGGMSSFDPSIMGVHPKPGDKMHLKIVPEYVTGAWQVAAGW